MTGISKESMPLIIGNAIPAATAQDGETVFRASAGRDRQPQRLLSRMIGTHIHGRVRRRDTRRQGIQRTKSSPDQKANLTWRVLKDGIPDPTGLPLRYDSNQENDFVGWIPGIIFRQVMTPPQQNLLWVLFCDLALFELIYRCALPRL